VANFNSLLNQFPRADGLRGLIEQRISSGETFESILRTLRDDEDYVVRQFQQVPLYLRLLLGEVSRRSFGTRRKT
jgi:hypothetical protein